MRYENKKVLLSGLLAAVVTVVTGFSSYAAETQSDAQPISSMNEVRAELPLSDITTKKIPEIAATSVKIQEEKKKAAEEAARKAAEEAARKKAAREAARKKAARKRAAAKKRKKNAKTKASSNERTLLASIIYCEAGNQSFKGQVAVGAVIMNRVRSSSYPNSIRSVIYQKGQFGPAITGKLDRAISRGSATSSCYKAADAALAGSNPVGDALYFGNGNYGQKIGDHWFH